MTKLFQAGGTIQSLTGAELYDGIPVNFAASQNDWELQDITNAGCYLLNPQAASLNVTGITHARSGRTLRLVNAQPVGGNSFTLKNQSGSSAASHQFYLDGADIVVPPQNVVDLMCLANETGWVLAGTSVPDVAGGGTVTSVGLADGSTTPIFAITGSPVVGAGTLTETLKTQTANTALAGPTSGAAAQPTFRALVNADMPASGAGSGTVTSVGFADTSTTPIYTVTNSPVTASGTIDITLNVQVKNTVLAGPTVGANAQPTFRTIVAADLPAGVPTASANPSATVGLAAVNGSAATFMTSDSAPPLSQAIAPTWTGTHVFSAAAPATFWQQTGAGANLGWWSLSVAAGVLQIGSNTDIEGAGASVINATRGVTTAIGNVGIGSGTCTYTFGGSGLATFTGAITVPASVTANRFIVQNSTVPATAGIYLPAANVLGFASGGAASGSFDANGNFICLHARADQSYSLQAPITGFSITIGNNISALLLNPAGTLATGTITMPATPIDGQIIRVASSHIVTTLTVSANAGQTILGAPTTITASAGFSYIYNLSATTWYRLY